MTTRTDQRPVEAEPMQVPSGARVSPYRRVWAVGLHSLRVILLLAIIWSIRLKHVEFLAQQSHLRSTAVPLDRLTRFYPTAAKLEGWEESHAGRLVLDGQGNQLGYVVQTSPESDHVVGYAGPTNTLLAFDTDDHVLGIDILTSSDTLEHVANVLENDRFMRALIGLTWHEAASRRDIDGVSGATLTSLAILEGISCRLGSPRPSLRFPDQLTVSELQPFLPNTTEISRRSEQPQVWDALDAAGQRIGAALRTSPTTDGDTGYQGPTDTVIVLDAQDRIVGVGLRRSYDNEPYVRYVREDEYFRTRFNGLTLEELARLEPEAAGVEGVSGATMTSMTIARGLPRAAQAGLVKRPPPRRLVVAARDVGTVTVVALALLTTFTPLRGRRRWNTLFRVGLVVYLGFLNGDMLSQTVTVGWAQNGAAWRLAPGLVVLAAAALLVPILSRRQVYCQRICPFGAAQQLIRGRVPWQIRAVAKWRRWLTMIPAGLLLLAFVTAIFHLPINLAGIEPFDAFVFWIAGAATLTIAVIGLVASAVVPLAYCRFGCPTGAMLEYLRFHSRSDRLSRGDLLAVGLLIIGAVV